MDRAVHYFIISLLCIGALSSLSIASANKLYVFYPTDVRPKSLQGKINTLCPEINTVAFGRVVDFYRQIDRMPPNAILSLKPVVTRKQTHQGGLKGTLNGQYKEEYVLVSLDKPVDLKNIAQLKIGVLDILGRRAMKIFINDLFDSRINIKRVVKIEDFLPLLTFKLADAIFVSRSTFDKLKSKSRQNLVAVETGLSIGLAVIGVYQQNDNKINRCIKNLDQPTNALLGVDHWEGQL
ncbi:MAG: hypothetical protein KZQ83_10755 [gamma proteobacterium symbiont of Taylorina sp.]|nr:hypothetical protein [gamma proteobacterium symbiont of Taylorina sp.]